ncbi:MULTISPECIES: phage tail protein [unclassified Sedimentibacter]|uniref:phage tail protein n=1 Tax=unclassified Sedimentibacter TaxID=2649220 RepID=UPI0027E09971|nr:hypothetical protein [Sedimentibacter sp. MB35-C1]WMJ78484.1 hypothetical protein RBQ61_06065 [Sedimentibacter sp. MB35-C1]
MFGSILVDSSKAEESISKTEKSANSLGTKLGNGIKTAGKWGLAIGAGATAAGVALLGVANKAAETTDHIDKMSQKIGMSKEGFQEWDFILSQNGASIDSMQSGMKTLTNQVDELSKGGKVATDAFSQLGLSYEDMAGLSQEEIFEKTVIALQGVEDTTKRAAIANDLLGKSGSELAPLLNAGADSVEAMKKQAKDLGLVLSDDAVNAGVKFTDTMDQLKRSFGAVFTQVGAAVMPMFVDFANWIINNMPVIQNVFKTVFDVINQVVSVAYNWFNDYLLPIFDVIFSWVKSNWPAISGIINTAFKSIADIVERVWRIFNNDLLPILRALWDFISPTFPLIQKVVETTFGAITNTVEGVVSVFERVAGAIRTAIDWLASWNNTDVKNKDVSVSSTNNPRIDGSHASGLAYVPFDGYVAELHRGERVLPANSSSKLDELISIISLLLHKLSSDSTDKTRKEIKIGTLMNIEKNIMEDDVDVEILEKEMGRLIRLL